MEPITGFNPLSNFVEEKTKKETAASENTTSSVSSTVIKDTAEISDTSKVFSQVDHFMNLGNPDRVDVGSMSPAERKEFIKIVANLLHHGVVGYEVLKVNGQPEKHFIENEIGDERIRGAKLYKNGRDDDN